MKKSIVWKKFRDILNDLAENTKNLSIYPLCEVINLSADGEKSYYTPAALIKDEKIHSVCNLKPGEIDNFGVLMLKFGEKVFAEVSDKDFLVIIEKYKKHLVNVETIQVYEQGGWIDDESFILGDLLITNTKIQKVERFDENQREIEVSDNFNFILPHMLGIFENKMLSSISLIYLTLSLLTSKLPKNSNSFSTLLAFIGQSGSRKTSFTTAFFNPLEISDNQCSFEDSKAAIEESFRSLKDCTLIVDDVSR